LPIATPSGGTRGAPPPGITRSVVFAALASDYRAGNEAVAALARAHRGRLLGFVFLDLDYATALERVQTRPGHFFSPDLVANQFTTLEDPRQEPDVLTVSATMNLNDIALAARQWARRDSQA
jgi:gluconate kinase